ncbi:Bax inhibitor-1/YccA family protein [Catellatospora tritici]|uniref:Bax inhibitor-1/YccA family protein n=1 Tax=Catellatospora tritici TaxID=2851566 RepID=UPI001C2DEE3A|nr:Bax inhibitor-1/YccA family protein [Catellatospora tritici]MBV1849627.1 Bax inhibitor-1/YccA family protein [Catellatospora tritici]
MKSSNPVLSRIGAAAQQPRYTVPGQGVPTSYTPGGYPEVVQTGHADVMTLDDVVVKTITLVSLTAVSAAAAWILVPFEALLPVWAGAAIVGFIMGLIISFAQVTNPLVVCGYAVVQGVVLGALSRAYNYFFDGIVLQAVIATLGVFLLMAVLYRTKVIRATPKFMRVVIGAVMGVVAVMVVNLVITLVTGSATPLRDGSPIAIGFSLVCILLAALMFVVNFKQIEDGIAAGLPRKYGWLGAFGLLVELIWMYVEILRLLSYLQED